MIVEKLEASANLAMNEAEQVGMTGQPLRGAALLHCRVHRFRCRQCDTVFCSSCGEVPYHIGFTCEEYMEYKEAAKCRYCDDVVQRPIPFSHQVLLRSSLLVFSLLTSHFPLLTSLTHPLSTDRLTHGLTECHCVVCFHHRDDHLCAPAHVYQTLTCVNNHEGADEQKRTTDRRDDEKAKRSRHFGTSSLRVASDPVTSPPQHRGKRLHEL